MGELECADETVISGIVSIVDPRRRTRPCPVGLVLRLACLALWKELCVCRELQWYKTSSFIEL
jgi:hypothetical protein